MKYLIKYIYSNKPVTFASYCSVVSIFIIPVYIKRIDMGYKTNTIEKDNMVLVK